MTALLPTALFRDDSQKIQQQIHLMTHFIEINRQVAMLMAEVAQIDVEDGVAVGHRTIGVEQGEGLFYNGGNCECQ